MTIVAAVLKLLSFFGLCAGIRAVFGLRDTVAPFAAVCGITVVLVLGGMAGGLEIAAWLLYVLGFAGAVYAYILKRSFPRPQLVIAFLLYGAFLLWCFRNTIITRNDDISHWGLVTRLLLTKNRFPNQADVIVKFQSYPLGSAAIGYYVCHLVTSAESAYYFAYNLVLAPLFLPVLSAGGTRKKQTLAHSIFTVMFIFLFFFFRFVEYLQVETQIAFFAIGIAGAIANYRALPRKALAVAIPGCIAVTMIKNDGIFFAAASAAALYIVYRRNGRKKSAAFGAFASALLSAAAMFLLWNLHIRSAFSDALSSKHAVSVAAYIAQIREKGVPTMLAIAKAVLTELKNHALSVPSGFEVALILIVVAFLYARKSDFGASARRMILLSLLVYVIWTVGVLAMYMVSMPTGEALRAASFYRYNGCGLEYVLGLLTIVTLICIDRSERTLPALNRIAPVVSALAIVVMLIPYLVSNPPYLKRKIKPNQVLLPVRAQIAEWKAQNDLPSGRRYMVFYAMSGNDEPFIIPHTVKYEFETADMRCVWCNTNNGAYLAGDLITQENLEDLDAFIAENAPECEAVLILGDPETYGEHLSAIPEGVRVLYPHA